MPPTRRRPSTRSQQRLVPYTRKDLNGKYRVCSSCGCNIELYNYLNVTCSEDFPTCIDCRLTEDVRATLAQLDDKGQAFTAELKARIIDEQTTKLDSWSTTMIKDPKIELVPSSEAMYWAQDGFRKLLDGREKAANLPAAPADTHHDAEDPGPTTAGQLAANRDPSPAPADFDQPSEANEPEVYYLGPANPDVDQDPEGGWPLPYIPPTDAEHIMKTVRTMLALMEHITDPALRPKDIDELKLTFKDNASQLWLAQLDYDVMTVRAEREKQREKLDALDRWVEGVLNV